MDLLDINTYTAAATDKGVVVSVLTSMVLGALWYSPWLFGTPWLRLAHGVTNGILPPGKEHPPTAYLAAMVCSIATAVALRAVIPAHASPFLAAQHAAAIATLLVGTSFCTTYAFADRPFGLTAIDAGYHIARAAVVGYILASLA